MSPALNITSNGLAPWKPLRGKETALGAYEYRGMDFRLTKIPGSSFWPVTWALLLNRCGDKHEGLRVGMNHWTGADGDWTMYPPTVTINPKSTVANMVKERVYQGNSVTDVVNPSYLDTMVDVVAKG
ncbi:hypothetical protein IWQ61_001376 [Dispira simplex]|nr:hypothetical protein IWQ61_001376 [Dispira simplex]